MALLLGCKKKYFPSIRRLKLHPWDQLKTKNRLQVTLYKKFGKLYRFQNEQDVADSVKQGAQQAADKTKEARQNVGEKVQEAGEKMQDRRKRVPIYL